MRGASSRRRSVYEDQGYLLVPGVLPADDVDAICTEMDGVAEALRSRRGSLEAAWPGTYRQHMADDLERILELLLADGE